MAGFYYDGKPPSVFDERDAAILAERQAALNEVPGPRVGDFVIFGDGTTRRVSHDWGDRVQTSDGGSYYLGNGYVSMSGSLYSSTPKADLVDTGEVRDGAVWFFHHDFPTAHNGVHVNMPFRVYRTEHQPTR